MMNFKQIGGVIQETLPTTKKWYIYLFEHPMLLLGLFGMFLIFLAITGDENFDFWIFKHLKLTRWTKIVSFITGLLFILVMLGSLVQ